MYKLAEQPDALAAVLLRALTHRVAPSMSVSDAVNNADSPAPTMALTQLFFALGHVAVREGEGERGREEREGVHAEAIQEDMKRARAAEHEKSSKTKKVPRKYIYRMSYYNIYILFKYMDLLFEYMDLNIYAVYTYLGCRRG